LVPEPSDAHAVPFQRAIVVLGPPGMVKLWPPATRSPFAVSISV
jgi:hypothetical protein